MNLFEPTRDVLKDLPVSDSVYERLSLALDRLKDAEAKVDALQIDTGRLLAQLERERLDHKQTREELQRLQAENTEEVRIYSFVEFRRGKRTGGKWLGFCPRCHAPAADHVAREPLVYCTANCGWSVYPKRLLSTMIAQLLRDRNT